MLLVSGFRRPSMLPLGFEVQGPNEASRYCENDPLLNDPLRLEVVLQFG